jgi:hypothetical protein
VPKEQLVELAETTRTRRPRCSRSGPWASTSTPAVPG